MSPHFHDGLRQAPGKSYGGVGCRGSVPLTLSVTSPGEGRIEAEGVHHAQHRLLDVEVMMLVIKMALRAPVSPRITVVSPERAAASQRVAFALQVLHGYLLLLAPRRPRL